MEGDNKTASVHDGCDGRFSSHGELYRLDSGRSSTSIFEDVEMAHDELYSGPMAESLPTSISSFTHRRRTRAHSTTSFTLYNEEDKQAELCARVLGSQQAPNDMDEAAFDTEHEEDTEAGPDLRTEEIMQAQLEESMDMEARQGFAETPRDSSRHHLLPRRDSGVSNGSGIRSMRRTSQKIHMANEDLYIVIAGFRTSPLGLAAYLLISVSTLGLGWLLFRWFPKLQVKLVGQQTSLRDCRWVVVENQWNEMTMLRVEQRRYGRALSTVFGTAGKRTYVVDEDDDPIVEHLRTLDYRYVRFYFHEFRDQFLMCTGWNDTLWTDVRTIREGISSEDKRAREIVFGNNAIDAEQKSAIRLLVDEVFHPFYVFQMASLVLWSMDRYYYYAIAILALSVGSIATTLLETRSTMERLREMARFECDVRVLRNGFWRRLLSGDLVPGDIYEVSDPSLSQIPADSLLLSGDCIANESMLTGESVPVSKTPATDETLQRLALAASTVLPDVAKHFLFSGTTVIRARRPREDGQDEAIALAMVVRTGFNTTKGALVRSMLFPKPSGLHFYRDSFRYISVMGCVAVVGFIASLVNFVRLHVGWHLIVVRALDLVTIVIPPALPATLTIGTNFALTRLKRQHIFCISPQRVNVGGKLDMICFDKTGTLTEEGLDILGVRVVSRETGRFSDVMTDAEAFVPNDGHGRGVEGAQGAAKAALHAMATCHSLRRVDDELVGDPLDRKMFEFTGWSLEEGQHGGGGRTLDAEEPGGALHPMVARPPNSHNAMGRPVELGVLKSFEFVSQLRRASVVVRTFGQKSGDIYVKGAPECMRDICKPESFPADYDELIAFYTHRGYRVIGCATKHLGRMSWVKAQKMTRQDVESDLDFVGSIIFENRLKPATTAVLQELLGSDICAVMVTGDNILTAISVARECALIGKTAHCFVPRFVAGHAREARSKIQWESIDKPTYQLDDTTLLPLPAPVEGDASLPYDVSDLRNYTIAVSGDVFRWIVDFASPDVMHRMLVAAKVFARMSPDEKHELVEKLQSIDYCVGFCGDGANDCGALKAADVGISLSEAEASVAAPFTSRVFDIRCVPEVIREGRAALVTSFSCFKYMSLYSTIQFASVSFLYASASNLGDFQFLFIDLALILPIAVLMSWAGPHRSLCRKRPTADLVSPKVLVPLLGQMALCFAVQAAIVVAIRRQTWYRQPKVHPDRSNIRNSENTALFLTSCFEYILSGLVLNAGRPFRQGPLQNWPFVLSITTALIFAVYMVLAPAAWLGHLMQLTFMSWGFKLFVLVLGLVVYFSLAWMGEHYLFPRLARAVGCLNGVAMRSKKRKKYKLIRESMAF